MSPRPRRTALLRHVRQRPGERQLVADRGYWFVGWIESRQTNTDQLVSLPCQSYLCPRTLFMLINHHGKMTGFGTVIVICHRRLILSELASQKT